MIKHENQEEITQPKKSGILFIVFGLGFLAVLSSGYAVLTAFNQNEAAMQNTAAVIGAQARSSQGISQNLPQDPALVEESSVGILNDKLMVPPKATR
jgi:flagellar basal body-associated protein FliL